ncbi:hypothetical protein P1J78_06825 [Psychromarinibacter sp. C21-152]|uniref:Uncharacterized protein n=1 Tax=Psychromarinibacter sediminicola TaxID=3033385 RepID=A0AAE3NTT4_9RHOB|nr:hypothetical protein [Psychromarinibacter sediminicola]MDF0600437.1 hypothetical protein [Psychromarinibacter sediminicola]
MHLHHVFRARPLLTALFAALVAAPSAIAQSNSMQVTPPVPIEPFEGRWNTNHGELRLHQVRRDPASYIIGDYANRGIIVGLVSPDGQCAHGVFTNGAESGGFQFVLDQGGEFSGLWAWHGEPPAGEWTGTRVGDAPRQLSGFTRGGGTLQVIDQPRAIMSGLYDSRHGTLDLASRDLFLWGAYADKGIIAGQWDGNGFVGQFTNDGRVGWFDFDVLSKTGTVRGGQWGWHGEGKRGAWTPSDYTGQVTPILDAVDVGGHLSC